LANAFLLLFILFAFVGLNILDNLFVAGFNILVAGLNIVDILSKTPILYYILIYYAGWSKCLPVGV